MKTYLALFALSLCLSSFADTAPAAPPEWEGSAEASLLLTSGNTELTTGGLGLATTYRPDPWTVGAKLNYLTSKDAGTLKAESFNTEARGERKIVEALSVFVNASYLKNRFTGFEDRIGSEAGLSYLLLQQDTHTLTTEVSAGILKENRVGAASDSFATGKLGVEYKWKFSPTAEFATAFSYLDNLKTMKDWRFSNTSSVTAILTSLFSLKVSFKVDYLNVPVIGKKSTDTTTTVALVAKF